MPGRRGAGQSRQLTSTPKGRTAVTNGVFPNSSCLTALHPKLNKAQTRDESLPFILSIWGICGLLIIRIYYLKIHSYKPTENTSSFLPNFNKLKTKCFTWLLFFSGSCQINHNNLFNITIYHSIICCLKALTLKHNVPFRLSSRKGHWTEKE